MLERFSITISATTIIAVLGKVALLYRADRDTGKDWFVGDIDQNILCHILLGIFLIFFRGKMMHDDASFFIELAAPGKFKSDRVSKGFIKFGLLLGYLSWLLWAPAIYFLEDRPRFASCLILSLILSTIWLLIDIWTRVKADINRAIWIFPNLFYVTFLVVLQYPPWATAGAAGLLLVVIIDWLVTDPFSGHVIGQ